MSFFSDIVGVATKAIETVAPMALSAIFPPAAMMGPLANLATSVLGGGLSDVLGQLGKAGDLPNFVAKEAQNLLGGVVSQLMKAVRELAAILAELEGKEAKNVQNAVQKASDALGVAKSGKPEDAQKDADIGAQQFQAMEQSKAEAQIFSALSSAINEVMKKFGEALGTAGRA
jgi:hypothetical protein